MPWATAKTIKYPILSEFIKKKQAPVRGIGA
jgi:hypothetical protein